MAAHNPASRANNQFVRVRLPDTKYEAYAWQPTGLKFVPVQIDILEQKHITNTKFETLDYEMFIPCDI